MRYSKLGYWGLQAAGIGLFLIGAVVVLLMPPAGPSLLKFLILSGVSILAMAVTLSAYRKADEIIMQTHKTAWLWGCMAAFTVMIPLMIAVLWRLIDLPALVPIIPQDPGIFFTLGALTVLLLEAAGFLAFWAYHNFGR